MLNINIKNEGGLTGIENAFPSVDGQKKAEQKNRKLEKLLRDTQRIAHLGYWETNIITEEWYWSDEFYHICGLEPGELSPSPDSFKKISHPEDYDRIISTFEKAKEKTKKHEFNCRIVRPTGEVRYVHAVVENTFDNDKTLTSIQGIFHDITEQVIITNEAKTLETSLLEAQRIANFGSWIWNLEDDSFEASKGTLRLIGAQIGQDIPTMERCMTYIHEEDREYSTGVFVKALKSNKKSYRLDMRLQRQDGEIRSIFVQAEIRRNLEGRATEVFGTLLDITERKRAEEAAKISEKRLLEAQRIGGLGNWHWDFKTNKVEWSDQLYRIYGYDKKKIKASFDNFRRILHPDDADLLDTTLENSIKNGAIFESEHRLILDCGDIRSVIQRAEIERDADGEVKALHGKLQDITELKKAEKIAKESEARLSEIFNIAPAAIVTTDHLMQITIFNKFAVQTFGYQPEEVIGKHINLLIPEQYRKGHDHKIDGFNNSGKQSRNMNERSGIYGLKNNGEAFPASASVSSVGNGIEKIYTVILLDTTERKRIEEERMNALSHAQEANTAKSQFLATMSHELRTPLNAIIGFSEMMTNQVFGALGSDKYTEYAGDIVGSSRHLLNLVNDILDLSEIESGKKSINITRLSLRDTIDECQYIIHKLAADKDIECSFDIPDDMTLIYADQRALKQVIINIMTNAVKFTKAGGAIKLEVDSVDNDHIITITDNGEGIPEDRLEDILNPFTRVENDPYTTQDGKGLGLAIVKSLMNLHGGNIQVESVYGEGTKVILTFPDKI